MSRTFPTIPITAEGVTGAVVAEDEEAKLDE